MSRLKQQFPWNGVLPCHAAGIDFVLMHAHDDVVGWEYLWWGPDGYEPEIIRTWVGWARDSRRVLDIGAYTGLMSVLAARANPRSRVTMFEPIDKLAQRAQVNVRLNGVSKRVGIRNVAASDAKGPMKINLYRNRSFLGTGSALDEKPGSAVIDSLRIRRVVLDEKFPALRPDLVKIDVEGHELAVLRGMAGLVARGRPRMIIEVWRSTQAEVLDLLGSWGYTCEPFEDERLPVVNYRCTPA